MTTNRADALAPTKSGTRTVTLGTKDPSGRGKNSNSATGSKSGKNAPPENNNVLVETEANNQEQGTGRRRVVQERGGQMGGHD